MSKSKKSLLAISSAVAPLVLLGASAFGQAAYTVYSIGGTPADPTQLNDWPSSPTGPQPTSAVGTNPLITSGGGGNLGSPDSATVAQGLNGSSSGSILGETFLTGATGFTLGEVAMIVSGAPNTLLTLHLFQLNTTVTGTSGGYTLSTAEVGTDLMGAGGAAFSYNGSSNEDLIELGLSGSDQVALLPNTEYALEFWNVDPANDNVSLYRMPGAQSYAGGGLYSASGTGAQADLSTAVRGGVSPSNRNLAFALYAAAPSATWTGTAGDGLWTTAGNWTGGVPDSAGEPVTFGPSISAPTTVNLNGNQTDGKLTFNSASQSYTIAQGAGSGTLTLNNLTNNAEIDDLSGSQTISAPLSLTSNLTVAVGRSQDTFTISGNVSGVGSVTLNGTSTSQAIGTVVLSGTNSYQGATTVNTGTLVVGAHGALPSTTTLTVGTATTTAAVKLAVNSGAQTISGLTINPNSTVDIGNNHFILDYAAGTQAATDSTILSYLQAGRNGGAWNGANGIISTGSSGTGVAAGYSIGYADGADHVVTGLSSGQIEVKYTLLGDANLDGLVTGDDFTILVGNLGKAVTGWDKGDFLYTGLVTGDDFTALVGNLGKSATGADVAIPAADYAAIDAFAAANGLTLPSVPEPASASLLIVAGMGILARRHRSCEA